MEATATTSVAGAPAGGRNRHAAPWLAGAAALLAISGCASVTERVSPSVAPATPNVSITTEDLVGNWGLGSFREEKDLPRTINEARRYCNNPYVITRGPNNGVMMYLADQSQPSEVVLKNASGRVYIGPPGPAGMPKDRQITSFQDGVIVAPWVDPSVTARYGTMVFVRCAPAAPAATPARPASG
ncbi:hypothetical protein [Kaistia sp. UC242_56]|uniref:hypothetical protein n=1 Tax=Kaistia sp. UC242_56 TaxID=3374625 RepID=UPI0037AC0AEC